MNIEIGKIIEIKNMQILVDIFDSIETSFKIKNGHIIKIGGISNYIKVGNLIYQIDTEKIENINSSKFENNKVIPTRTLLCNMIGYFDEHNLYRIGASSELPYLFQTVETLNYNELIQIYSNTSNLNNAIKIGKYVFEKSMDAYVNINDFFASHILLVGNTGSGKSNTLASLYTTLFQRHDLDFNNSKFLIIDTNGEYSKSFSKQKVIKKLDLRGLGTNELKIPINLVTLEDWQILTSAAEKTQFPMLKHVVEGIIYNIFTKNVSITDYIHGQVKITFNNIIKNSQRASQKRVAILSIIDILSKYDDYNNEVNNMRNFDDYINWSNEINVNSDRLTLSNAFDDATNVIISYLEQINNVDKTILEFGIDEFILLLQLEQIVRVNSFGLNDSHLAPFVARVIGNSQKYKKIFIPYRGGMTEDNQLENILFDNNHICVCDVSSAGKDMRRIIVSFILDKLYRGALNNRDQNNFEVQSTYHFIIDEAHNYLSPLNEDKKDLVYESCLDTIETIIKEGRKFGVFLTISTQRPSDITGTVLSQCHNYIIHKLVNPKDINIIENSIPFLDERGVKMLTVLSPGQAIFSGTAFNKANVVHVNKVSQSYEVNSKTPSLMSIWTKKDL